MKLKTVGAMMVCVLSLSASQSFAEPALKAAEFSAKSLSGWEEKEFDGYTKYELVQDEGKTVLKANSVQGASGLVREIEVDLKEYPYLNWSWKAETSLPTLKEDTKAGDDYVARVYVVKSGGFFFWKTIALNYVWSSAPASETPWPNAFAGDNAQMLAVRGSEDKTGAWVSEKRNIYEDFKRMFGEDVDQIDAIAIMTDTDNSKGSAVAYYGDIYFTKN
jgi:DUF3047 family protein